MATGQLEKSDRASGPGDGRAHWRILAAMTGGVMIFAATADIDIWPLAWVALCPILWAIDTARTRRRALLLAWLAGTVANTGGFYWIAGLLTRFASFPHGLAELTMLALAAYQGLVYLLFGLAVRSLRDRPAPLPMVVLAPLALVTFELLVPFIFPWYLAITQAWQPLVIQVADLTGPLGVTAALAAAAGGLYDAATGRDRRGLICLGAAGALVAAVLIYGAIRLHQFDQRRASAPALAVGIVQPNVGFDEKGLHRKELALEQLGDLQAQSAALEREGAELIVWPESSYPFAVPRSRGRDFAEDQRIRLRRGFEAPLIAGAITYDDADPDADPYNSAIMVTSDGTFVARADKIFLLMFGEYVPLKDTLPFIAKLVPPAAGSFRAGSEPATLPLVMDGRAYQLGVMICYEDILPAFGRKLADKRPHLLINVTNDAWFGDTAEPWQHMALSVYRAVEMRTDLVRAVNTGVSALIGANGRLLAESYAVDPKVDPRPADRLLVPAVLLEGGDTVFAAIGNLFGWMCAGALLLAALWPRVRGGRARPHR